MAVAMMALEATVIIQGASGNRSVPLNEFYLLPGSTPQKENVLAPGELITHVTLPALPERHALALFEAAGSRFV